MKMTSIFSRLFMSLLALAFMHDVYSQSCPSGLISYWRLDETSGTSLSEVVAGYTATRNSSTGNVSGKIGNSQRFTYTVNGSNNAYTYSEYATVPHNSSFNFPANSSFTISYWVRYTEYSYGFQDHIMVSKGDWGGGGATADGMFASGANGSGKINFLLRDNTGYKIDLEGPNGYGNGAWHHVACVRDESSNKNILYVDGTVTDEATYNYTGSFSTTMDLQIGCLVNGGVRGYFYKGDIDEVAIFNRALSSTEINAIITSANSGVGICSVSNVAPTFTSTPVTVGSVGEAYAYTAQATGSPASMTYSLTTSPAGMTINASSGLISWTPAAVGSFAVTVRADNGVDPDATQSFSINVSGSNPNITSSPVTTATLGEAYTYDVNATGTQAGMTYSLVTAPAGMTINATSGVISWTPAAVGDVDVEVKASNGILPDDTQSFTITVSGESPNITSTPPTSAYIGALYSYDVSATGTQAGMTYSLVTAPAGMTINATTGLISWTPAALGDVDVEVKAANGIIPDDTQSFTITVSEPTNCPEGIISLHKLDESAGPDYADFYDEHNAVALVSPTATAGIIDGAQQFSAITKIDIPDNGTEFDWLQGRSFSFECWVKTSSTAAMVAIGRNRTDYVAARWLVGTNSSGQATFELRDNGGPNQVISGTTVISDNQWHHIVAVREGETNLNRLYVDGVEEASVTRDYVYSFKADNPLAVTIGYLKGAANEMNFIGAIDEVVIYDRALAPTEVTSFYNGGNPAGHCNGANNPPYFTTTPSTTVNEDAGYSYTATVNDADVSDVLVISAQVKPYWLNFSWTAGQKSATLSGVPTNSNVGENDVVLRVSDGEMSRDQIFRIIVNNVNDAPVKTSTPVTSVDEGSLYSYTLTVNDVDAGDVITMAVVSKPSWLNFAWTPGTRTATLSGTPGQANIGVSYVDISFTDGKVTVHEAYNLTVNEVNSAPVITGQSALSVNEDQGITILKSNLTITDADNPQSDITITVQSGTNYTFTGNTVTPAANFNGQLNVNVIASDLLEDSPVYPVVVTVNPVNDPPVITGQNSLSFNEDQSIAITKANLTITDVDNPAGDITIAVQAGDHYTFSGNTVTADVNYNGTLTVNIRARDLADDSQVYGASVTVNPVNDPPVITSEPTLTVTAGELYTYTLTATDVDNVTLIKSAVNIPGWLTFSAVDGVLSGTPTATHVGPHDVTLRVSDGTVDVDKSFTITVSASPTAIPEISDGEFIVYPTPANDLLHIKFNELYGETVIHIISAAGTVVETRTLPAGTDIAHINVQQLDAGVYFCRISNDKVDRIARFLIAR